MNIEELKTLATQVRRDILRMVYHAKSGHPGGSLGCADFLTALYTNILQATPQSFTEKGKGEDMFFLSNGHISPVWYSVLARTGYFPVSELATFRVFGSRLQGHPSNHYNLPGIRIASGSLGQGLSIAVGAALAKKLNNDSQTVYVLTGDGELDEGQNWEAILFASANKVDNLIAVVDYNKKQIDGSTDDVCSLGNLRAKFEAFDWQVMEMDGNDMADILDKMAIAKDNTRNQKPVVVLMHTEMGMGVDFMMGTHKWHGTPPNTEQIEKALAQLPETIGDY
ncbi:transketolase [Bacteroidales bacterium OttesenSCG-928-B11]|nr:transketolase [Bacteroidales bacterium OttesenSCG-928-B11]MDL2325746.1 transketolase [Bacteroidales bacterium OttesenSCG-928-A14]